MRQAYTITCDQLKYIHQRVKWAESHDVALCCALGPPLKGYTKPLLLVSRSVAFLATVSDHRAWSADHRTCCRQQPDRFSWFPALSQLQLYCTGGARVSDT